MKALNGDNIPNPAGIPIFFFPRIKLLLRGFHGNVQRAARLEMTNEMS